MNGAAGTREKKRASYGRAKKTERKNLKRGLRVFHLEGKEGRNSG